MNNKRVKESISKIKKVLGNVSLPENKSADAKLKLQEIEMRNNDKHLYLGIVGEFSSGKSTLINALIGKDFFITDAWQGTTTIPTHIRYAANVDLIINYKDGQQQTYSGSKRSLLERFLPNVYNKLTSWQKITLGLKGLFSANNYDKEMLQLFDLLTTSDELAEIISEVIVEYPSEILKDGLVIIDTPGTDSTNPQHKKIAEETIAKKCDLAFVIIPSERPLSMTLASFVKRNMGHSLDKCVFFLTKVELIKKPEERVRLYNGVKNRIQSMMSINNPLLINAPTLLFLEHNNIVEPSGLLNHFTEFEKKEMTELYRQNVDNLLSQIYESKEETISHKLKVLLNTILAELTIELSNKDKELSRNLQILKQLRTKPLRDFMTEFFRTEDLAQQYYSLNSKMKEKCSSEASSLIWHVRWEIDRITPNNSDNPKDDTQDIMESSDVKSYGESCFNDCYTYFLSLLKEIQTEYEKSFARFRKEFTNSFSIEALDFEFSLQTKTSWQKKYQVRFDKDSITTGTIARWWKDLSEVQAEMKEAIRPYIEQGFDKISKSYTSIIEKVNQDLEFQMEQIRQRFISKFEKVIQRRIQEELRNEERIKAELEEIKNTVKTLNEEKSNL